MDDRPPPDNTEKIIRFGCGALFGGVILTLLFGRIFGFEGALLLKVVAGAVICGLLAIRYGDAIYEGIAKVLQMFWWW